MTRLQIVICFFVSLFFAEHSAQAAENIGAVERIHGQTQAMNEGRSRPLATGSAVQFLDTLQTGSAARVNVTFVDGTDLFLGEHSELSIDEMVYEPGVRGRGVLRLNQGVFRLVSGQVNKLPGATLEIVTPFATIGVRGTDFWGEQTPDKLTMALLDDGELILTTKEGSVTLTDPLSAVVIRKGEVPGTLFKLTPKALQDALATISWP